jgi:hypothetical protein
MDQNCPCHPCRWRIARPIRWRLPQPPWDCLAGTWLDRHGDIDQCCRVLSLEAQSGSHANEHTVETGVCGARVRPHCGNSCSRSPLPTHQLSDAGLQPERTALSWGRTASALFVAAAYVFRTGWIHRSELISATGLVLLVANGLLVTAVASRNRSLFTHPRDLHVVAWWLPASISACLTLSGAAMLVVLVCSHEGQLIRSARNARMRFAQLGDMSAAVITPGACPHRAANIPAPAVNERQGAATRAYAPV